MLNYIIVSIFAMILGFSILIGKIINYSTNKQVLDNRTLIFLFLESIAFGLMTIFSPWIYSWPGWVNNVFFLLVLTIALSFFLFNQKKLKLITILILPIGFFIFSIILWTVKITIPMKLKYAFGVLGILLFFSAEIEKFIKNNSQEKVSKLFIFLTTILWVIYRYGKIVYTRVENFWLNVIAMVLASLIAVMNLISLIKSLFLKSGFKTIF